MILTLGALMQEDDKFKISLGYGVRPLVQTKQNNPFLICCCEVRTGRHGNRMGTGTLKVRGKEKYYIRW